MALYWPEQKVALDIVDDPHRNPFEGDESYTVLRVTCAELSNYESFDRIQKKLCKLLGASYPQGKEWKRKNRRLFEMLRACGMGDDGSGEADSEPTEESDEFGERDMFDGDLLDDLMENMSSLCEEVEILAPSREAADYMAAAAEQEGHSVRGISIWEGPIPEGSFRQLSPHMRMSTPEFFFMRKANDLPLAQAVNLGNELCGRYRTALTSQDLDEDYEYFAHPRTTKARIRKYLRGAHGTRECKRAKRVLRYVSDECCSPIASYLSVRLSLPVTQGGYGLSRATFGGVFEGEDGLAPAADGPYLAYDLTWPEKGVSLQYVGVRKPSKEAIEALNAEGIQTIRVRDADLCNPDRFDKIARKVADLLEETVPEQDDAKWLAARDKLCETIAVPDFKNMQLTLGCITSHMA